MVGCACDGKVSYKSRDTMKYLNLLTLLVFAFLFGNRLHVNIAINDET